LEESTLEPDSPESGSFPLCTIPSNDDFAPTEIPTTAVAVEQIPEA